MQCLEIFADSVFNPQLTEVYIPLQQILSTINHLEQLLRAKLLPAINENKALATCRAQFEDIAEPILLNKFTV